MDGRTDGICDSTTTKNQLVSTHAIQGGAIPKKPHLGLQKGEENFKSHAPNPLVSATFQRDPKLNNYMCVKFKNLSNVSQNI